MRKCIWVSHMNRTEQYAEAEGGMDGLKDGKVIEAVHFCTMEKYPKIVESLRLYI